MCIPPAKPWTKIVLRDVIPEQLRDQSPSKIPSPSSSGTQSPSNLIETGVLRDPVPEQFATHFRGEMHIISVPLLPNPLSGLVIMSNGL